MIMDEATVYRSLARITHEIIERTDGANDVCILGVKSRGTVIGSSIRLPSHRMWERATKSSLLLCASMISMRIPAYWTSPFFSSFFTLPTFRSKRPTGPPPFSQLLNFRCILSHLFSEWKKIFLVNVHLPPPARQRKKMVARRANQCYPEAG